MREIKFRGKRIDNNNWIYGYLVKNLKGGLGIQGEESGSEWGRCRRINTETVGEYTGLKDVNGKEIYEGDIVKNRFFDERENLIAEETNIVDFDRAAFVFAPSCKHRGLSIDGFSQRYHWRYIEHEVIGNVYENPERLELEHTEAKHSCD